MEKKLSTYLQFAIHAAFEAGRTTLNYFNNGVEVEFKEDNTPVTMADRKAEEILRKLIKEKFPDHAVIGEEFGEKSNPGKSHCWYIDPIDGTKSFIRGVPLYAVLLGLEIEERVDVGVVYFPALDEMIYAASGQGTFWNERPVSVRDTDTLSRSFVAYTDVLHFEQYDKKDAWDRIQRSTYYRVGWSDAYGHALVATGRLELMLDPVMNSWDCGPFPVILREAGGYFGDWSGNETIHGGEALSTTKKLLPEVLKLINDQNL